MSETSRNGSGSHPGGTDFGRLLTAMVTPFDSMDKVNYGQAQRLAVALLDSGSDGVVVGRPRCAADIIGAGTGLDAWAS